MTHSPKSIVEAALMAAGRSMTLEEIASIIPSEDDPMQILRELHDDYAERGIDVVSTAGGWALRTKEDASDLATHLAEPPKRLTPAALQTMIVVLCYQPVTRSEIERVRGVQISPGVMQQLLEAKYVKPGPRRDTPGRPLTWMATETFLEAYDLISAQDLPSHRRLQEAGLFELPKIVSSDSGTEPSVIPGLSE